MSFTHLLSEQISAVHEAAVHLRLSRGVLLAGIDRDYAASLEDGDSAGASLLLDLQQLNRVEQLTDGSVPLRQWLEAARRLAGPQVEAAVFAGALDTLARRAATTAPQAALPPPPQRFVGRNPLAGKLTTAVLRAHAPSIVLLGPGGIGKSTLTLAVLHRSKVAARFGVRRWFVRLDTAPSAEAAIGLVATALGLSPRGRPLAEVCGFLGQAPGVLALDNLETPWWGDGEAVDRALGELAAIPGLVLVASVRGVERPAGVAWKETFKVQPLDANPAADLFCQIAQARRGDAALAPLLARLEGVPLAITLLAHVADGANLRGLAREWEQKHTALLQKSGAKPGRETSWAASMALSLASPRMTGEARLLLGLLGRLPDGVAFVDLPALVPGKGDEAERTLVQVALGYEESDRLRALAPVREYAREAVALAEGDLARSMDHYGELARTLGPKVGAEGGAEAVLRLAPETANLDAMIREGLKGGEARRWIETALALAGFARHAGHASRSLLEAAASAAHDVEYVLGEANCAQSLGHVAIDRAELEEARRRYGEALPLYRRVGAVLGEANCIKSLGDIALRRAEHEEARRRYGEALPLYRRVGHVLGEANCAWSLGEIALARSDHGEARRRYDEALPLYRRVGQVVGEANCIESLGDIALACSEHEEARRRYDEALPLFRRAGHVLGEANCIAGHGEIAQKLSDPVAAKKHYGAALALYTRVAEPYSMGQAHRALARLATDPAEKQDHVAAARALWTQIDRLDLVAELDRRLQAPAGH